MSQTIKGMLLGILMTLMSTFIISGISHAEWFNSSAPRSDSSTLRRIAEAMEQIAANTSKLSETQAKLLELQRSSTE